MTNVVQMAHGQVGRYANKTQTNENRSTVYVLHVSFTRRSSSYYGRSTSPTLRE